MNRTLLILVFAVACLNGIASEPERGYRGFVDANVEMGLHQSFYYYPDGASSDGSNSAYWIYGISTSHGYQFNPHLFIGGGIWIQLGAGDIMRRLEVPVFAHVRTDWTFGKVPLFGEVRIGGTVSSREFDTGQDKIQISPAFGYRLDWGKNVCANFAVGLTLHGIDDSGWRAHITFKPLPLIKVGIEF